MAVKSNPVTLFLYNDRNITLSLWAKKHGFNATSVRNTFYGIRPIKKIVLYVEEHDKEIFDLLPIESKSIIEATI